MMPQVQPVRSVEAVAAQYVEARGKNGRPVSTAEAVRAIRMALANCPLSNRELGDVVARTAIERGLNVNFDGFEKERPERDR